MDTVFMVISLITMPFLALMHLCPCTRGAAHKVEGWLDSSYSAVFGLTKMGMEGFRRMRTSAQLTFESVPQIGC